MKPPKFIGNHIKSIEPAIFVIFGITGDLAKRRILPALYHLIKDKLLNEQTVILGISRREISGNDLIDNTNLCVNEPSGICDKPAVLKIKRALKMLKLDLEDANAYGQLKTMLDGIEAEHGICLNRLYYLSIPPQAYPTVIHNLGIADLNNSCSHGNAKTRLLVEKPFGLDTASARQLINDTAKVFKETQIFRIDHYVAKETVQNILTFRLRNPIFRDLWDAKHISRIEINGYEKIGIEGRSVFYERIGAMRDFIQSHLLQLLAIVTMELPENTSNIAVHAVKQDLLQSIIPIKYNRVKYDAVRGQYEGYKTDAKNPKSNVETFVAIKLNINNKRWHDIPVFISTGKALNQKNTEISIVFGKDISKNDHIKVVNQTVNILRFRIQPNEGIILNLEVKKPGFDNDMQIATMDFSYQREFSDNHGHPDAYERVLVDAVKGDQTLFATSSEVMAAWAVIENVLQSWKKDNRGLEIYKAGTDPNKLLSKLI